MTEKILVLAVYPKKKDQPDFEVEVTLDEHNLALILGVDLPLDSCYPIANDQAQRLIRYEAIADHGEVKKVTEKHQCFVEFRTTPPVRKEPRERTTYEYDGESLTITGWSEKSGISVNILAARLRLNWTIADALTTPVRERRS